MSRRATESDRDDMSILDRAPKKKRKSYDEGACPECGSGEIEEASSIDVKGYATYCCMVCGHYFVAKAIEATPEEE